MAELAKGPRGQGNKRKRNSNNKSNAQRTSSEAHRHAVTSAAGQERKNSPAVRNASKDLLAMFGKAESEGKPMPNPGSETPGKAAGKGKKSSGSAGKKGTSGGGTKKLDQKQGSQAVRDAARQLLADLGGGAGALAATTEPSSTSKVDEAPTKQSNTKQPAAKAEGQEKKGKANRQKKPLKLRGEDEHQDGLQGGAGDDGDGRMSNEKRRKKRKKALQKSSRSDADDAERKQQQHEEKEEDEGREDWDGGVSAMAAAAAAAAPGAASRKGAKRLKVQQHLLVKGETLTPASLSERKFDTDSTDHCETPFEAYRDIEPFLFRIAKGLKKSKAELRIYDPYYCEGSMLKHLSKLGFTSVYNRNEDFYAAIARGKVPEHDVVVTNPPFSGDHMSKIVAFCAQNPTGPKPFFLLMPNFVMRKSYYKDSVSDGPRDVPSPMLLAPKKAYKFWSPGRSKFCSRFVANTRGGVGAATPFETIWYLGGLRTKSAKETREWWRRKYEQAAMCSLAEDETGLPDNMVPVKVVGGEKRMNPRRRKAMIAAKKQQRNRP